MRISFIYGWYIIFLTRNLTNKRSGIGSVTVFCIPTIIVAPRVYSNTHSHTIIAFIIQRIIPKRICGCKSTYVIPKMKIICYNIRSSSPIRPYADERRITNFSLICNSYIIINVSKENIVKVCPGYGQFPPFVSQSKLLDLQKLFFATKTKFLQH